MIDVRDVDIQKKIVVLFCQECEEQFGAAMELRYDFSDRTQMGMARRKALLSKFWKMHQDCGAGLDSETSDRIARALGNVDERTAFALRMYDERPGIRFSDLAKSWGLEKKDVAEVGF